MDGLICTSYKSDKQDLQLSIPYILLKTQLALALQVAPSNRALRLRVISFLHRMVECLGQQFLPYCPDFLSALLQSTSDKIDLMDVFTLVLQLITRYKAAVHPLLLSVGFWPHHPRQLKFWDHIWAWSTRVKINRVKGLCYLQSVSNYTHHADVQHRQDIVQQWARYPSCMFSRLKAHSNELSCQIWYVNLLAEDKQPEIRP